MTPIISKPTHITKETATAIYNIFVSSDTTTKTKTILVQGHISDQFSILFVTDNKIHIKEAKYIRTLYIRTQSF